MNVNGAELDVRERGSGEPVVFIHGGMGDECAAIVQEPALTGNYRVVDYHRRCWGNSSSPKIPVSIKQQASDCRAIMEHLGIERGHVVGQSYGGVISLQVALDAPSTVHSLTIIEPPVPSLIFGSAEFGAMFEEVGARYAAGNKAGAIEAFAVGVGGEDFRAVFDRMLPAGAFDRWVAAADTMFKGEDGALAEWVFTEKEAARITQPVLNMTGVDTRAYFREIYETLQKWLPQAENVVLPDANHCVLQMNPAGAAERLAGFFERHPIQ
jgi:pimeloyl-ACP methyl ester carboxylesterase